MLRLTYSYRTNVRKDGDMCGYRKTVAEIKANENSFATFMAAMILKYGPEVLKELEEKRNKSAS